jgi:hypothetical protein
LLLVNVIGKSLLVIAEAGGIPAVNLRIGGSPRDRRELNFLSGLTVL